MEEMIINLEESVLNELAAKGTVVRIVFTTGYQVQAKILDFSCDVILIEAKDHKWMVYRHAVSTIDLG